MRASAVRNPISAYAHGYLQAGVFLAIGLASIAVALALWFSRHQVQAWLVAHHGLHTDRALGRGHVGVLGRR